MKNLLLSLVLIMSSAVSYAATEVNDKNFQKEVVEALKNGDTLVVKMYATWCGPCQSYKPVFESVEKKYAGKAKFIEVDIDQAPKASAGVRSVPTTFVLTPKGAYVTTGALSEAQLEKFINDAMKK